MVAGRRARVVRPEYREEPCKTALTRVAGGMPFRWSLNPYMGCQHRCTFCYVRAFEQRAERASGAGYGLSIRVKTNVVEVLRREVSRPRWRREAVGIGSATDPYQPAEGRYRLTRGCIEVLAAARTPFSIVTRGPLVVRDIDVLRDASQRAEVSVSVSVPTLDEAVWLRTEPGTAPPRQRLRAVRMLVDAGIRAGVAMAPVLPGISDGIAQVREVVDAAREAGATHLWGQALYLRPGTREYFMERLAEDWPRAVPAYEGMYRTVFPPAAYSRPLGERVRGLVRDAGIRDRRSLRLEPPPPERQLTLFDPPVPASIPARSSRGIVTRRRERGAA